MYARILFVDKIHVYVKDVYKQHFQPKKMNKCPNSLRVSIAVRIDSQTVGPNLDSEQKAYYWRIQNTAR